jgi:D-alanyl-D-alanine carboxypeptidase
MRLASGWAAALAATLVLSLVLAAPTTAPGGVAASPGASASPLPSATSTYTDGDIPDIPHGPSQGGGSGPADPGRAQPLPADSAAELAAALDRARSAFGLNVLALGVTTDSGTWTRVSGVARDGVTPLDADSPFAIASITKTFTATLVLQLVEEGRLALDDEVGPLLPDVALPEGVTVRQLLSHTSGVADLLEPMRALMNADPERIWTAREVLAQIGPPRFAPGSDYAYSNTNYVILGLLVEELSGQPFADVLRTRILQPLALDRTGILTEPGAPPLMTPSWASAFGTSGFMYSSVGDLLAWADDLYLGNVLRRSSLAQMLTFSPDGYGLGAQQIELGDQPGYGHSGLLRGFTSLMVHLPAENVTLVVIGTWQGFEPAALLTRPVDGQPSVLDLALQAAASS